jgi:hypothetical protein
VEKFLLTAAEGFNSSGICFNSEGIDEQEFRRHNGVCQNVNMVVLTRDPLVKIKEEQAVYVAGSFAVLAGHMSRKFRCW